MVLHICICGEHCFSYCDCPRSREIRPSLPRGVPSGAGSARHLHAMMKHIDPQICYSELTVSSLEMNALAAGTSLRQRMASQSSALIQGEVEDWVGWTGVGSDRVDQGVEYGGGFGGDGSRGTFLFQEVDVGVGVGVVGWIRGGGSGSRRHNSAPAASPPRKQCTPPLLLDCSLLNALKF